MIVLRLALKSLVNRWVTALLTIATIAASVVLLLGVEEVRTGARQSFADTISGTDLIVGARSGALNLLLHSVFRIGNATNNITWETYQDIAKRPEVAWIVPLSLGDSHRGFRVLGTENSYFEHYRYRRGQHLQLDAVAQHTAQHVVQVGQHGVEVHARGPQHLAPAERHELLGHARRAPDLVQDLPRVFTAAVLGVESQHQQLGVAGDGGQRVVHVLGDGAGQALHGLHGLRLAELFLQQPALGHILEQRDDVRDLRA